MKRDEEQMLAIVHKLGFADLKTFSAALKANPKEHPQTATQLLDAYRGYINQMKPAPARALRPPAQGSARSHRHARRHRRRQRRRLLRSRRRRRAAARATSTSTSSTLPTARSPTLKPSPTTKASPAITSRSPSHRSSPALPEFRKQSYYNRLHRGLGALLRASRQRDRLLPGSLLRLWPSAGRHVAGDSPRRRQPASTPSTGAASR